MAEHGRNAPVRVLGLSAFHGDSAAALIEGGHIVAAAQEERFTRRKHDAAFPHAAATYCLEAGGCRPDQLDAVVFYDRSVRPERLHRELAALGAGFEAVSRLLFTERHLAQAAAAFFPSPFEEAAVLVLDGSGADIPTAMAMGKGNRLEVVSEQPFPHSLGLLYAAVTAYLGFKPNSGEYKVMGLAPYGRPHFASRIFERLIDLREDGGFSLAEAYFAQGLALCGPHLADLFGAPPRAAEAPLTQFHMDVAASIQAVTEDVVLRRARTLARKTGAANLCLGGGVALNCVANGKLKRENLFADIWIQPAAGDAAGALGAALVGYHMLLDGPRLVTPGGDTMQGSFLGPAYAEPDVERRLSEAGARFHVLDDEGLFAAVAEALASGQAVGWIQGRMEFGPRALGGRSILADARSPHMQRILNDKIKYREAFRPFAPSVLASESARWFDLAGSSPYMLLVAPVKEAVSSAIPAVTHVDRSARVQTVDAYTHPRFHALLSRFNALTGCPVLVNTSFNVRGEPIVNTPEDAFRCFMGSDLDLLAVGNCLLRKDEQDPALRLDYRDAFEAD